MNLRARLRDFLHELRIARLYNAHVAASKDPFGSLGERMRTWRAFQRAVAERSPEAARASRNG